MNARILEKTRDMTRQEWLKSRRQGLGGSDAPVIMGLSPYKSPAELWLEKTEQFDEEDLSDVEAVYWGNVLEDVVAKEFTIRTGLKTRRRNAILQHPEDPWLIANVDRLVVREDAGLECKTTNAYYKDTGEVTPQWHAQVQHYMLVTGLPKWFVAVLAGGQRFYLYEVEQDLSYQEKLRERARDFWQAVESATFPEVDGSESSARALEQQYPRPEEEIEIELPFEAFALVEQYEEATNQEKAAKEAKKEAANALKQHLGGATKGWIYNREIRWAPAKRSSFNSKKLREERPDLYDQYITEKEYSRLTVTRKEAE